MKHRLEDIIHFLYCHFVVVIGEEYNWHARLFADRSDKVHVAMVKSKYQDMVRQSSFDAVVVFPHEVLHFLDQDLVVVVSLQELLERLEDFSISP